MSHNNELSKKPICSPTAENNGYTCYSSKSLDKLKNLWNLRHPDVKITATSPKKIWKALKKNMSNVCSTEKCWLHQEFAKDKITSEIANYTFAPTAPENWKSNPNEWLSSVDIEAVMKQHEKKMNNFVFIGPSPIDFDVQLSYGECVWDDLCKFKLEKHIKNGKNAIGFIFNLDPHFKDGSHWFSTFVDLKKKFLFFIDSTGDSMPKQVRVLVDRIIEEAHQLNIPLTLYENKKAHQRTNTECGIYSLFIILELLYKRKTPQYFMTTRVPDKDMIILRKKYFNEN